ncbi:hypothetical protein [Bowdeniella nasicola]|uniref:hypothetical protein n=1 Tax=Bowdeniella nasicola TaxID=208480 RepID=UPI001160F144|nr:hypothetical protein [Bowdeniella nasicola]
MTALLSSTTTPLHHYEGLNSYAGTRNGYSLFRSTYTGGYQDCSSIYPGDVCLTGRPAFQFVSGGACSNSGRDRYSAVTRAVVVNGETIFFTRTLDYLDGSTYIGLPPAARGSSTNRSAKTEGEEEAQENLPRVEANL